MTEEEKEKAKATAAAGVGAGVGTAGGVAAMNKLRLGAMSFSRTIKPAWT